MQSHNIMIICALQAKLTRENNDIMLQTSLGPQCLAIFIFGGIMDNVARSFVEGVCLLTVA